ncbi:MAG: hypothetical protein ACUVWP_09525 [bacterium]
MMKRLTIIITILSIILPIISKAEEFTGWWKNLYDSLITPEATTNEEILNILNEYYKEYIVRDKNIYNKTDDLLKAIFEGKEKEAMKIIGDISNINYSLEKIKVKALIKIIPLLSDLQKEALRGLLIPAYPTPIETTIPKKIED